MDGLVVEQRTHHQITAEPMKFLTLASGLTGMVGDGTVRADLQKLRNGDGVVSGAGSHRDGCLSRCGRIHTLTFGLGSQRSGSSRQPCGAEANEKEKLVAQAA
jgi:hypothetical protein